LPIAIANDLPLQAAWQVNVAYERIAWVCGALALVAVAFRPAGIITAIACVLV